jgi:hypothetical protein
LKWLPIVFVRLIQSQRTVVVAAKYGTATARLRNCRIFPMHSYEIYSMSYHIELYVFYLAGIFEYLTLL